MLMAVLLGFAVQDGVLATFEALNWITRDDYPKEALPARLSGRVVFLLDVDEEGRPFKCTVLRSSGTDLLDNRTCDLIQKRAKFKPGTTVGGLPVQSIKVGYFDWAPPSP